MLYLGEQDIQDAVTPGEVMDAIERAYRIHEDGTYDMPQRMHVIHQESIVLYMPCFMKSIFGTKILTLFPGNAGKNKPVIEGLMLLNDAETGAPLALLNGAKLTAIRTGGVGGVGIRHTSPEHVSTIGLIGAGVQGWQQLIFAAKARRLEHISVFDLDKDRLQDFVARLQRILPETVITAADSPEELLAASEIVITTTSSRLPVLPDRADLLQGKHFIGIGSYKPDMREYPEALYRLLDQVFVDTEHGLHESGDLLTPLEKGWVKREQFETFGHWLARKAEGEGTVGGTTLFKSVGMALFDLVVGELIYRKALEQGVGQNISY